MTYIDADGNPEGWRPVPEFEDVYEVSDLGRIRRICPYCHKCHTNPLAGHITEQNYTVVCLTRCSKEQRFFVHAVVAAAFLGPRPCGLWINHKDGNKQNNRLSNLEYCTPRENLIHAVVTGLRPAMKLNPEKVRQIRNLKGVRGSGKVGREFNISNTQVKLIWNRKAWAHLPD